MSTPTSDAPTTDWPETFERLNERYRDLEHQRRDVALAEAAVASANAALTTARTALHDNTRAIMDDSETLKRRSVSILRGCAVARCHLDDREPRYVFDERRLDQRDGEVMFYTGLDALAGHEVGFGLVIRFGFNQYYLIDPLECDLAF